MIAGAPVEELLRPLVPQVVGALARRYGHFDACEDAVQEALVAAVTQWPEQGVPEQPRGWLITVASRRLTEELRRGSARQRRQDAVAAEPVGGDVVDHDDTLTLLFMCCHPSLTAASQLALTLRAVGGLTTAEIASAFLVPEATMAQRISRAKQTIKMAGAPFHLPPEPERRERLGVVLHVLYLVFNEGYTASAGVDLQRVDLGEEAIRLARMLHTELPHEDEVAGLLALLLLTHARRRARTDEVGALVPLVEQDRSRWDGDLIEEGVALLTSVLPHGPVGPYQVQAAIAAVHDEAATDAETDWPQIVGLYDVLLRFDRNPIVALNRTVALAKVAGPQAALDAVAELEAQGRLAGHHRLAAVRAHLLDELGDTESARAAYRLAAGNAPNLAERRHLERRAARLA